jgi:hypothetical protein
MKTKKISTNYSESFCCFDKQEMTGEWGNILFVGLVGVPGAALSAQVLFVVFFPIIPCALVCAVMSIYFPLFQRN